MSPGSTPRSDSWARSASISGHDSSPSERPPSSAPKQRSVSASQTSRRPDPPPGRGLELPQLLEWVDAHVRVRADADPDPALAEPLEGRESISEVGFGGGTDADTGARRGKQVELVVVGVRGVNDRRAGPEAAAAVEQLDRSQPVLGKAFGHVPARPERMLVRQGPGHRLVRVDAIERFTAEDGLVYAELTDVRHATDYTIQELEERFRGAFLRVSRADLVSIAHVGTIAGNRDGSATLSLTSGQTVHVSRRRASEVR